MQHAHVVGPMPQDGLMAQLAAQMEAQQAPPYSSAQQRGVLEK
ncbi:hypothetical protein HaLaN_02369 [Haematococcus lacustris]|uniref:Uncharacterized protein n=1 Tax=Haematococcus lacustris TaxID=44745 RepID=A0A699YDS4_HAELA|nr:hypothetical protein HaLaN_02369 [Haematococcus lacustris]